MKEIAGRVGEARVTIRNMMSATVLALLVGMALTAGFFILSDAGAASDATKDRISAAKAQAAEAVTLTEALEERVDGLEAEVQQADEDRTETAADLRALSRRLDGSLERLKSSMSKLRAGAADAAGQAGAALSRVESVARDLTVLRGRYDLHLRRFHGGG